MVIDKSSEFKLATEFFFSSKSKKSKVLKDRSLDPYRHLVYREKVKTYKVIGFKHLYIADTFLLCIYYIKALDKNLESIKLNRIEAFLSILLPESSKLVYSSLP